MPPLQSMCPRRHTYSLSYSLCCRDSLHCHRRCYSVHCHYTLCRRRYSLCLRFSLRRAACTVSAMPPLQSPPAQSTTSPPIQSTQPQWSTPPPLQSSEVFVRIRVAFCNLYHYITLETLTSLLDNCLRCMTYLLRRRRIEDIDS